MCCGSHQRKVMSNNTSYFTKRHMFHPQTYTIKSIQSGTEAEKNTSTLIRCHTDVQLTPVTNGYRDYRARANETHLALHYLQHYLHIRVALKLSLNLTISLFFFFYSEDQYRVAKKQGNTCEWFNGIADWSYYVTGSSLWNRICKRREPCTAERLGNIVSQSNNQIQCVKNINSIQYFQHLEKWITSKQYFQNQ